MHPYYVITKLSLYMYQRRIQYRRTNYVPYTSTGNILKSNLWRVAIAEQSDSQDDWNDVHTDSLRGG